MTTFHRINFNYSVLPLEDSQKDESQIDTTHTLPALTSRQMFLLDDKILPKMEKKDLGAIFENFLKECEKGSMPLPFLYLSGFSFAPLLLNTCPDYPREHFYAQKLPERILEFYICCPDEEINFYIKQLQASLDEQCAQWQNRLVVTNPRIAFIFLRQSEKQQLELVDLLFPLEHPIFLKNGEEFSFYPISYRGSSFKAFEHALGDCDPKIFSQGNLVLLLDRMTQGMRMPGKIEADFQPEEVSSAIDWIVALETIDPLYASINYINLITLTSHSSFKVQSPLLARNFAEKALSPFQEIFSLNFKDNISLSSILSLLEIFCLRAAETTEEREASLAHYHSPFLIYEFANFNLQFPLNLERAISELSFFPRKSHKDLLSLTTHFFSPSNFSSVNEIIPTYLYTEKICQEILKFCQSDDPMLNFIGLHLAVSSPLEPALKKALFILTLESITELLETDYEPFHLNVCKILSIKETHQNSMNFENMLYLLLSNQDKEKILIHLLQLVRKQQHPVCTLKTLIHALQTLQLQGSSILLTEVALTIIHLINTSNYSLEYDAIKSLENTLLDLARSFVNSDLQVAMNLLLMLDKLNDQKPIRTSPNPFIYTILIDDILSKTEDSAIGCLILDLFNKKKNIDSLLNSSQKSILEHFRYNFTPWNDEGRFKAYLEQNSFIEVKELLSRAINKNQLGIRGLILIQEVFDKKYQQSKQYDIDLVNCWFTEVNKIKGLNPDHIIQFKWFVIHLPLVHATNDLLKLISHRLVDSCHSSFLELDFPFLKTLQTLSLPLPKAEHVPPFIFTTLAQEIKKSDSEKELIYFYFRENFDSKLLPQAEIIVCQNTILLSLTTYFQLKNRHNDLFFCLKILVERLQTLEPISLTIINVLVNPINTMENTLGIITLIHTIATYKREDLGSYFSEFLMHFNKFWKECEGEEFTENINFFEWINALKGEQRQEIEKLLSVLFNTFNKQNDISSSKRLVCLLTTFPSYAQRLIVNCRTDYASLFHILNRFQLNNEYVALANLFNNAGFFKILNRATEDLLSDVLFELISINVESYVTFFSNLKMDDSTVNEVLLAHSTIEKYLEIKYFLFEQLRIAFSITQDIHRIYPLIELNFLNIIPILHLNRELYSPLAQSLDLTPLNQPFKAGFLFNYTENPIQDLSLAHKQGVRLSKPSIKWDLIEAIEKTELCIVKILICDKKEGELKIKTEDQLKGFKWLLVFVSRPHSMITWKQIGRLLPYFLTSKNHSPVAIEVILQISKTLTSLNITFPVKDTIDYILEKTHSSLKIPTALCVIQLVDYFFNQDFTKEWGLVYALKSLNIVLDHCDNESKNITLKRRTITNEHLIICASLFDKCGEAQMDEYRAITPHSVHVIPFIYDYGLARLKYFLALEAKEIFLAEIDLISTLINKDLLTHPTYNEFLSLLLKSIYNCTSTRPAAFIIYLRFSALIFKKLNDLAKDCENDLKIKMIKLLVSFALNLSNLGIDAKINKKSHLLWAYYMCWKLYSPIYLEATKENNKKRTRNKILNKLREVGKDLGMTEKLGNLKREGEKIGYQFVNLFNKYKEKHNKELLNEIQNLEAKILTFPQTQDLKEEVKMLIVEIFGFFYELDVTIISTFFNFLIDQLSNWLFLYLKNIADICIFTESFFGYLNDFLDTAKFTQWEKNDKELLLESITGIFCKIDTKLSNLIDNNFDPINFLKIIISLEKLIQLGFFDSTPLLPLMFVYKINKNNQLNIGWINNLFVSMKARFDKNSKYENCFNVLLLKLINNRNNAFAGDIKNLQEGYGPEKGNEIVYITQLLFILMKKTHKIEINESRNIADNIESKSLIYWTSPDLID